MGEPADRQVRRRRACEVERPLNAPGAKKNTAMSSDFRISDCSSSWIMQANMTMKLCR